MDIFQLRVGRPSNFLGHLHFNFPACFRHFILWETTWCCWGGCFQNTGWFLVGHVFNQASRPITDFCNRIKVRQSYLFACPIHINALFMWCPGTIENAICLGWLLLASLTLVIQNVCWRGWNDVRKFVAAIQTCPKHPWNKNQLGQTYDICFCKVEVVLVLFISTCYWTCWDGISLKVAFNNWTTMQCGITKIPCHPFRYDQPTMEPKWIDPIQNRA